MPESIGHTSAGIDFILRKVGAADLAPNHFWHTYRPLPRLPTERVELVRCAPPSPPLSKDAASVGSQAAARAPRSAPSAYARDAIPPKSASPSATAATD